MCEDIDPKLYAAEGITEGQSHEPISAKERGVWAARLMGRALLFTGQLVAAAVVATREKAAIVIEKSDSGTEVHP